MLAGRYMLHIAMAEGAPEAHEGYGKPDDA